MSSHHATTSNSVLHITITRVISLVTEELLHQVFDVYGMNEVCVLQKPTHVEAFVEFQSWLEASQARGALHGRCISDDCCLLDIQHALPSISVHRLPNGAPVVVDWVDWECEEMEPLTSSHPPSASTVAPLSAPPSAPTETAATPTEPTLAQIAERLNFHMTRLQATLDDLRNSRARAESTAVGDDKVLTQVGGSSLFLELDMAEDAQVITCVGGVSIFLELDVQIHTSEISVVAAIPLVFDGMPTRSDNSDNGTPKLLHDLPIWDPGPQANLEPHDDVFTTVEGLSIFVEEAGVNSDTDVLTSVGGLLLSLELDTSLAAKVFADVVFNEEIANHSFNHDGLYCFLDLCLDSSHSELTEKSPWTWHAFSTWNWDPGIPLHIVDVRSVGNLHLIDPSVMRTGLCPPVLLFKAVTYGVCFTLPWDPGKHIYVDNVQLNTFTQELLDAVGRTEKDMWFRSYEVSVRRYGHSTRQWDPGILQFIYMHVSDKLVPVSCFRQDASVPGWYVGSNEFLGKNVCSVTPLSARLQFIQRVPRKSWSW